MLGRAARVLLVEDDEDFRLISQDWLHRAGYAVSVAEDGLVAIEMASRNRFDVVVTDLKMPNCGGLQLLSRLKDIDPDVEVVFLTGQATIDDAVEALRGGRSFDFLQKPLRDLSRLDEVIRRALAHRRSLGNLRDDAPDEAWQRLTAEVQAAVGQEPVLTKAFHYIEIHFRDRISLREVATALDYSPSYLTNLMRRVTGKTVHQWIIDYKMAEAQRLLKENAWPIQRIASAVGYTDANGFYKQFRKSVGMTPQACRQGEMPSDEGEVPGA